MSDVTGWDVQQFIMALDQIRNALIDINATLMQAEASRERQARVAKYVPPSRDATF